MRKLATHFVEPAGECGKWTYAVCGMGMYGRAYTRYKRSVKCRRCLRVLIARIRHASGDV